MFFEEGGDAFWVEGGPHNRIVVKPVDPEVAGSERLEDVEWDFDLRQRLMRNHSRCCVMENGDELRLHYWVIKVVEFV